VAYAVLVDLDNFKTRQRQCRKTTTELNAKPGLLKCSSVEHAAGCEGYLSLVNKPEDSLFSFFAAFFSFGVMAGFFLTSLLLFCPLLMVFAPK
jgi:hypothetical protein